MNMKLIQISSGKGPAECCLAVALALKTLLEEARRQNISCELIDRHPGQENGTLVSALVKIEGELAEQFAQSWTGILLWICPSPYRKFHKRKNWFIGIESYDPPKNSALEEKDIRYQSLKASGPGGQHVNKVETAVRAIHLPSGIKATASDSRSQLQNKKAARERLALLLRANELETLKNEQQQQWLQHHRLQRGNPVRTYVGKTFKAM